MQGHSERLAGFGAAALNARLPMPDGLVGPDGLPSPRRFDVYRNNVIVGLSEALRAAYPVIHRLVGDAFFRAMAAYFVRRDPPESPVLLTYGARFPAFLEIFQPVAHLPWLADVARIERARLEAYHAAEALPMTASALGAIAPGDFGAQRFRLHPSARLTTSRHPALSIWRRNLAQGAPEPMEPNAAGEDALLIRPEAEVTVYALPQGGAEFLRALMAGKTVMQAALDGFKVTPRFDLQENLSGLMMARAFTGLALQPETEDADFV